MILKRRQLIENETIIISGSKSISNRLLILKSLFNNIRLDGLSTSQDTQLLQQALSSEEEVIDVHHAGTSMRFLTAYFATLENRKVILTGSDRMKQRPIYPLVDALRDLGAEIYYLEKEGYPPLEIRGKKITKSVVSILANISSQFISALMLIGARLQNGLRIKLEGEITSLPYLEMTSQLLKEIGVENDLSKEEIVIKPCKNRDSRLNYISVESDWSSASYYYAMCAVGKKSINIRCFKTNSLQGDSAVEDLFWKYFGVNTISDSSVGKLSLLFNRGFRYPNKIKLNMNDYPDIAQTLCVTAALLKIPFEISGLKTLKIKETDRLVALQNELIKIGCVTEIDNESIRSVEFKEVDSPIYIHTYNDHRMAMAFSVASLLHDVEIENENVVEKSYPEFWRDFNAITELIK